MTAADRARSFALPAGAVAVGIGWRHPHYEALLQELPALDFIEVHSENFFGEGGAGLALLRQARQSYPVSLHGVGLSLGSAHGIDAWHLDQLARLVDTIDPVRVSDHASFARGQRDGATQAPTVHGADLLPLPFTHEALDTLCANVQRVQERLRRPIAVENLSAYLHWRDADMTEARFLAELARRTGCTLLLDINNLFVNALNGRYGDDRLTPLQACQTWLESIPADRVTEIHLAGHRDCGDIVIDDHGSLVCDAVWQLYGDTLQRFGPVATLIEWDTDVPPLPVLLDEAWRARDRAALALQPALESATQAAPA